MQTPIRGTRLHSVEPQSILTHTEAVSLAPSRSVLTKATRLARPWAWLALGRTADSAPTLWGRMAGSKETVIVAAVRLHDLRMHCTCAARTEPCAHLVALLLLYAHQPAALPVGPAPPELHAHRPQWDTVPPLTQGDPGAAYARRRLPRLLACMDTLDRWLCDLVDGGLSAATYRPDPFWTTMANELDSAHAPRLAASVRTMAKLPGRAADWPDQLLAAMGRLYLLIQALRDYDQATPARRGDLHAAVGWPLLWDADRPQRARWHILAALPQPGRTAHQRTVWLAHAHTGACYAVTVRAGRGDHGALLRVGRTVDATLLPAHGGAPTAARLLHLHAVDAPPTLPPEAPAPEAQYGGIPHAGVMPVADVPRAHGRALAANPWHDSTPVLLRPDDVVHHDGRWYLRGPDGAALLLPAAFDHGWQLRAMSLQGGLTLFGGWDGDLLTPHAVWTDAGWTELRTLRGVK